MATTEVSGGDRVAVVKPQKSDWLPLTGWVFEVP